ncbi:MAG: radical SAM protein [Eubacteriales bacterium]|nr:radical SAM protein [Eubacteriales bacterium]
MIQDKLKKIYYGRQIHDNDLKKILCIRYTMTWRCNFKCASCNIWNNESLPHDDINSKDIDKFAKSVLLKDINEIILSGGEPILRDDFPDIILSLHRNFSKAKFSITLNGYNPERAHNFFKRIKDEAPDLEWDLIGISLNGPKEVHDKSRGVKGSFENAVKTAELLKEFSPCVHFSFTFLKENVDYFDWVCDFAKQKGLGVHICWTVMNDRFSTNEKDLVFQNNPDLVPVLERYSDVDQIKESGNIHKDYITYKQIIKKAYLYDSIINKRVMPCHAAKTFFHLAPNGDIFPCNFDLSEDRIMGNIKISDFDTIWKNAPKGLDQDIKSGTCMYPNGVCGDSDINRSICQVDTPVLKWYINKRKTNNRLIQK